MVKTSHPPQSNTGEKSQFESGFCTTGTNALPSLVTAWLRGLQGKGTAPEAIAGMSEDLQRDPNWLALLYNTLDKSWLPLETPSDYAKLKDLHTEKKGWWETNVEDQAANFLDEARASIPRGMLREQFDLNVGMFKGTYSFVSGFVEGIADLVMLIPKLCTSTKPWLAGLEFGKQAMILSFKLQYGTNDQKTEALEKIYGIGKSIFDAVVEDAAAQWEIAEREGKTTELTAKWATRGALEILTLAVAVLKGPQAARAAIVVTEEVANAGKLAQTTGKMVELGDSVADILKMPLDEFLAQEPAVHTRLFNSASRVVSEMKGEISNIAKSVAPDAKVDSILKRDSPDRLIAGIAEKVARKDYQQIGEMTDIVRGRVSLNNQQEVGEVFKRLQKRFPGMEFELNDHGPYPRIHAEIFDAASGLSYELQIGTKATTELLEGIKIPLPEKLKGLLGKNFHDVWYDHLSKLKKRNPGLYKKFGFSKLELPYNKLLRETGTGPVRDLRRKGRSLANRLAIAIQKMSREHSAELRALVTKK